MFKQWRISALTPLVLLTLVVSACGGGTTPTPSAGGGQQPGQGGAPPAAGGMIEHLDFGSFGGGDNPQLNYNPYSPNTLTAAYTWEPLMIVNGYNCQVVP